jgi:hypothetical protein
MFLLQCHAADNQECRDPAVLIPPSPVGGAAAPVCCVSISWAGRELVGLFRCGSSAGLLPYKARCMLQSVGIRKRHECVFPLLAAAPPAHEMLLQRILPPAVGAVGTVTRA